MDWARVMTALDAVPVVSERPAQQDASRPSQLHAAAFATTMNGAIMMIRVASPGGDATYAVVEKAVVRLMGSAFRLLCVVYVEPCVHRHSQPLGRLGQPKPNPDLG